MTTRVSPCSVKSIKFAAFTPEEIRKLSVLHITNPVTFDVLGYPVKGGLHDPLLGPNERFETCATCGKNSVHCTGHLGHIDLPIPVFHPVFMKSLFALLRCCCSSCFRFAASPPDALIFMAQMKAMNSNRIQLAYELEDLYGDTDEKIQDKTDGEKIAEIQAKLNSYFKAVDEDKGVPEHPLFVKNLVEARKKIIKSFWSSRVNTRKCPHCKLSIHKLAMEYNTRIIRRGAVLSNQVSSPKRSAKKKSAKTTRVLLSAPSAKELENTITELPDAANTKDDNLIIAEVLAASSNQTYITPLECQNLLRGVWKNNAALLTCLFGCLEISAKNPNLNFTSPVDIFFINVIPVPPSRFRPSSEIRGIKTQHLLTTQLAKVVQSCLVLNHVIDAIKRKQDNFIPPEIMTLLRTVSGNNISEKLQMLWGRLQHHINVIYDGNMEIAHGNDVKPPGIKQLLEKKQGLFRMHMMGKRVNYAARSVISPDPYIKVDEIGVPETFALKLTYPQSVTPWNVEELRRAVINGPNVHPGATYVQNEDGSLVKLNAANLARREAIAKRLLTPSLHSTLCGPKIVHRHLKNGDMLLVNRQPTLHKPSIMAHKARVLPKEKTLRLNYSNCKTYNADFDGDEMNAHFPQNELARAEAHVIASVNNQYLVPKDGTPLGGLIQDHIVSGVRLMIRGQFYTREDYQQLIFVALTHKDGEIKLLNPAILKPIPLWSGKQVISTIIINTVPASKKPLTCLSKSKIPDKTWQIKKPRFTLPGICMSETEVIIRNGELLCGILDKSHCGPTTYGLIHCCYELYGGETSGLLLSHFSRVFTHCLQITGFTLGVEDILLTEKADKRRHKLMRDAAAIGKAAAAKAMGTSESCEDRHLKSLLREAHLDPDGGKMKDLDNCMKEKIGGIVNAINTTCMPQGLLKKFPHNNLQLMVISGAKGSSVNTMQISCLLGQIELEGRRPPVMISGKTLPSFLPYDTSPRAGGFVDGRFLTGIRPQEYFFHCMAGREGLVDTAVKTSRSGYLQRCLIKHLEGVTVAYDMTVRDCDGSVIQFLFGEDSLDILKVPFLIRSQFDFFADNVDVEEVEGQINQLLQNTDYKEILKRHKKIRRFLKKRIEYRRNDAPFVKFSSEKKLECVEVDRIDHRTGRTVTSEEMCKMWRNQSTDEIKIYMQDRCPEPVTSKWRPDTNLGAICERLDYIIEDYLSNSQRFSECNSMPKDLFRKLIHHKALRCICEPGEAVGLLAAQSIGEPSTQMTLNTFHFAGRGDMNVTLGIPRLREILITAGKNISTPHMEAPFLSISRLEKRANKLRQRFTRICLNTILEKVAITENVSVKEKLRTYTLRFLFLSHNEYKWEITLRPKNVLSFMEGVFLKYFSALIQKKGAALSKSGLVSNVIFREAQEVVETGDNEENCGKSEKDADDSSDDEAATMIDEDTTTKQSKAKHNQEKEYSESEEDIMSEVEEDEVKDDKDRLDSPAERDKIEREEQDEVVGDEVNDLEQTRQLFENAKQRILAVKKISPIVADYSYDMKKEKWCEITYMFPISMPGLPMESILHTEVPKAFLNQTPGIRRAFVIENPNRSSPQRLSLQTEGVNIAEICKYSDILDMTRIYTNNIHKMVEMFGIEAGARVIVKEIQNVFGVYGISVDPRHLSLIADFMTFEGRFCGFNRAAMENSPSSLLQMTFETTMNFLREATLSGIPDYLQSPSARLVVGQPVGGGTGICSMLVPLRSSVISK